MPVHIDVNRGRKAADLLFHAFRTTGIHGNTEMPEDVLPVGIEHGSLAHVMFITLTVSIDYQRDANNLWEVSRQTYEDPETNYLFDPESLHLIPYAKIKQDMQKYKLSKKQDKDANIWRTVGVTFYKKWDGDPRKFLSSCGWNAPLTLRRLKSDTHSYAGRTIPDFPYLRGDKIGPLWIRMLRDNVELEEIRGLDRIPIPVDVHIARATFAIGVVQGKYKGTVTGIFEEIRKAWFQSVRGLDIDGREMIALDVDEPLWHLSKYGCTKRDKISGDCPLISTCEAHDFCIKGKVIVDGSKVEIDT